MKTAEQRKILRKHKKLPFYWKVISDKKDHLLVMNCFTGSFLVLDK